MATITSRVVDYDTDGGVPGVTVEGISENGTVFATATTDAEGYFSISDTNLDNLYSKLRFSKDGYAQQSMRPSSASVDVVLPKSNTLAGVTITLQQNKTKILLCIAVGLVLGFLYFKYFKNKIKL